MITLMLGWMTACAAPEAAVEAPSAARQAVELGAVRWTRDLDAPTERPRLVLFTEVPGCSTVIGFGEGPLSNPLLVEAIETGFTPVLVYNNTPDDAATCARFDEPRWNNPVIRVLDAKGATTGRFAGPYTDGALAAFLVAQQPKPATWLVDVARDLATPKAASATFAMGCFWSGEARLGGLDGVVSTRTGFQGGAEVVQVDYDPARTDLGSLQSASGYRVVKGGSFRPSPDDDRYYLARSRYAGVAMTDGQAARVNAALKDGHDPSALLSPRQRR